MLGCTDYITGEKFSFEIGNHIDQRKELSDFLRTYDGFWISFNGIHYDNMVLAFGQWNNWFLNIPTQEACQRLKQFSDRIIESEDLFSEEFKKYKYFKWRFINIDLFLYWSKDLRMSKKIGLKGLGIQLGYPIVQELPYNPNHYLNREEVENLKHYNLEHDLGILNLLTQAFEGKSKVPLGNLGTIQLREKVKILYGIDAWSMDAPKIASEVLLRAYCRKTDQDLNDVRKCRFQRPTIIFKDLFKDLNVQFQLPELKTLYTNWCSSIDSFNSTFVTGTENHPIRVTCGVGGIHSLNKNEIYESNEEYITITDDIAAMYPTNIENWSAFRFPEVLSTYVNFKHLRITETKPGMKKHSKGSPEWTDYFQQDLFYKLILNGVSGLLDMEHSWLFNPEGIMKVRCGGQLILLTLMEKCILNNIDVLSLNTDGLEVRMKKDQYPLYLDLVKQTEQQFNVQFEREKYNKIIYQNVNSYIAILENDSSKKKGDFVTQPELGNSVNFLVIPKMLEQYFTKGIYPKEFLSNIEKHNLHIYDFCASFKVSRDYQVIWNNEKQQRLNRFYVSKQGAFLYKQKNTKTKPDNMLKGVPVWLYNNHVEKPLLEYNIDFNYYISETNKIISEIERHGQTTLF